MILAKALLVTPYQNHSYDPCQNPAYNPSQSPYQPKLEALPPFQVVFSHFFSRCCVNHKTHKSRRFDILVKEKLCWITLTTRSCCRWRHKGLCQQELGGKKTPHCEDTRHCSLFWGGHTLFIIERWHHIVKTQDIALFWKTHSFSFHYIKMTPHCEDTTHCEDFKTLLSFGDTPTPLYQKANVWGYSLPGVQPRQGNGEASMNRCADLDFWPAAVWELLSLSNLEVLASRILIF